MHGRSRERRKWSGALAGGSALVMVAVLLPNPLTVPRVKTAEQAAYAPVPGPTVSHATANFAQVRPGSSDGVGDAVGWRPAAPDPLPVFRPRQKDCVGDPPRQTEDLLSPPCVPFFDGDNGGATWRGVTRDRVEVVLYAEGLHHEVDLTKPWRPSDEAPRESVFQRNLVRTMKAHLRYFQQRYQTYGRQVHVVARPAAVQDEDGRRAPNCVDRKASARETIRREPFAVVRLGLWGGACYRSPILNAGIMMFGINYDLPRADYLRHAPLHWGFFPDQETTAAHIASFFCRTLRDQPARFANDPTLRDTTRRFAALYPASVGGTGDMFAPEHEQIALLTVEQTRARCGLRIEQRAYDGDNWADILVGFKRSGITTILCRCPWTDVSVIQNSASAIAYFPEWFFEMPMTVAQYARVVGDAKQGGFGLLPRWRQPGFREQQHYQAYTRMEPGSRPNQASVEIYHALHSLFSGIQTAGPDLTPANVRRGMFTLNLVRPDDPWHPSGGWGRYAEAATGDYTFLDSAMAWWWDSTGTEPGGAPGEGCMRVARDGHRFFINDWPTDDAMLYDSAAPCTHGDIDWVDDR